MTPFDISTHDGLRAHYKDVRARLGITKPAARKPLYGAPIGPEAPLRWYGATGFVPMLVPDPPSPRYAPTLHEIAKAVCQVTGFTRLELESPRRWYPLARARMIYYFIARRHTSRSLPEIGRFMGGKDHSTVWHGVRKVDEERASFDPLLSRVLAALKIGEGP